jgi:hypothetical protein
MSECKEKQQKSSFKANKTINLDYERKGFLAIVSFFHNQADVIDMPCEGSPVRFPLATFSQSKSS